MRSSAKIDCIKTLVKFKRQEEVIEKGLEIFLENIKLEPEILKIIKNESFPRILERRKLANSLRASILDIKNCLKDIKLSVEDMREGREIDIEKFREKLVSLANKIREFKKDSTIEILEKDEIELSQDVNKFFLGLGKYEKRYSCDCKKSRESIVEDSQDYTGAKDFDDLIVKTGHTQNWSEADHLFFLKARKNCQSAASMVNAIRKKCPDLTAERIINHEAWYKIYLELREKQRRAIREWRENKKVKRREESGENKNEQENSESFGNGERNENDSETGTSDSKNNIDVKKTSNKTKIDKKEMIRRWRIDRENANSLESEKSKLEIQSRKDYEENRRLARARVIKSAIADYRDKKMEDTRSSSTASCTDLEKNSSMSNQKLIKCFRNQDEEFMKRRKAQLEKTKSQSTGILYKRVNNRCSSEHSKLLNPTKVWLEKCKTVKEPDPEITSRGISYVKYIPKLGSCNWKNQESV